MFRISYQNLLRILWHTIFHFLKLNSHRYHGSTISWKKLLINELKYIHEQTEPFTLRWLVGRLPFAKDSIRRGTHALPDLVELEWAKAWARRPEARIKVCNKKIPLQLNPSSNFGYAHQVFLLWHGLALFYVKSSSRSVAKGSISSRGKICKA